MKNIGLAILAISLSGCAAMSVEECKTANWSLVGEKDGSKGSSPRLDQYYKACGKANIVPDQKSYSQTTLLFIQDSKKTRNNSSTESINHSLRLRLTHAHICSIGF
ncbi:DUF2799 domain-containing protein, partial [Acinetobacter baumannii]|nr:DUF2799 domain-containing protein [Acinetobacter baumannii]